MTVDTESRQVRHACARCGQVLILHYLVRTAIEEEVAIRSRVPCVGDGCAGTVLVTYPQTAYAVWVEEL